MNIKSLGIVVALILIMFMSAIETSIVSLALPTIKMDLNVERWCSMKEICEYLGVSRDTVLAWIEKREMPATKIGRLWKFKISEVDAWMKSGVAAEK